MERVYQNRNLKRRWSRNELHDLGDYWSSAYSASYVPDQNDFDWDGSISGTINILEYNSTTHEIRATFNFIGEEPDNGDQINVTKGKLER